MSTNHNPFEEKGEPKRLLTYPPPPPSALRMKLFFFWFANAVRVRLSPVHLCPSQSLPSPLSPSPLLSVPPLPSQTAQQVQPDDIFFTDSRQSTGKVCVMCNSCTIQTFIRNVIVTVYLYLISPRLYDKC